MKVKAISGLYIMILTIGTIFSLYIPKNETSAEETVIIPDEAIRLRILANSDSDKDQEIKQQVRDAVNEEITKWVEDLTSLEEARALIQSRLPEIQRLTEEVLKESNVKHDIRVDFGMVEFPTKLYGEYLYPAGQYEAILITIGEGKGANWWCVLFPPLCFLDFSNGTAVSEGFDEEKQSQEEMEQQTEEIIAELERDVEELTSQLEEKKRNESINEEEIDNSDTEEAKKDEEQSENSESKHEEEDTEKEDSDIEKDEKADNTNKNNHKKEEKQKTKGDPLYVEEKEDEVEVKFFIVEIFQGFFS